MQFSDTTNKNGLVQSFEFWTRQPDGTVTGTLLKQATARINAAFDRLMPIFLSKNDQIRWDDINHTDAPIGKVNLVANQNDYKITADDNTLKVLNITKVRIKTSSTATSFTELERITADDPRVAAILSPDTSITGTPTGFVELGNVIYLDILPSYSATLGIELFFSREQSYFASTDTTKVPGFPLPFHELLALYAALDWNRVNRTTDTALISELKTEIARQEANLTAFVDLQNPAKTGMSVFQENNR